MGGLASDLAAGMVVEGWRQLGRGSLPRPSEMLLTPGNARRMTERLSRLRGAAMKVGQILSMEAGDLLPPQFTQILAQLRADAQPMPLSQVAGVLKRAWGPGWERGFRRFGLTPIAAASIGQVHVAETRDGRRLAIKIQYPGVRRSIDSDVDNVAALLRSVRLLPAQVDLRPLLAAVKRQLHEEADYLREADHLEDYRARIGEDPDFVLPTVDRPLTTPEVLAMSLIAAEPLESVRGAARELRDRIGGRLIALLLRELFDFGLMQTDPNPANYLYEPQTQRLALLDFGATRAYPPERREQYRRLFRAAIRRDRAATLDAARGIGYLGDNETAMQRDALIDMILEGCEPVRVLGPYDFAASDLVARLRARGLVLTLERGFWRVPPPDTAFLHRKFAGTYLACAQLGARVDVGRLLAPYVD
jgi:predicted unusual protein kinase regulating ubiquinone biosynthesis (AarF/ABC1/UbiB family)